MSTEKLTAVQGPVGFLDGVCFFALASAKGICALALAPLKQQVEFASCPLRFAFGLLPRENFTITPPHRITPAADVHLDILRSWMRSPSKRRPSLDLRGTPFQKQVWNMLLRVPVGQTLTYQELALSFGAPRAARAVARVCATNPLAIFIPCHRIVGKGGALRGYRWGIDIRRQLLNYEQKKIFEL